MVAQVVDALGHAPVARLMACVEALCVPTLTATADADAIDLQRFQVRPKCQVFMTSMPLDCEAPYRDSLDTGVPMPT
jgi:hypothetical protein